jgi:hypothetical protein
MDYYTVMFLNPKSGNRILMDGVTAEVEVKNNFFESSSWKVASKNIHPGPTHLDIVLEIQNTDHDQLEKIKAEIMMDEMLIYFKDTHPNLIKGRVTGMTIDSQKTTIRFTGNTTDKTYHDFVAEVTNKLNAEQINWFESPGDPINDGIIEPPKLEPKNKRKVKVLKRKLTFK